MSTVIRMDAFPRTQRRDWQAEAKLEGFTKALGLVKGLQRATDGEKRAAIANWTQSETLSEAEAKVAAEFYGWERAE